MVYCLSDIHGEFERFRRMLELIQFSGDDTLYVLGDVVDRGPDGVKALEYIMGQPNIQMLMGNHEWMCLAVLGPNSQAKAKNLWELNGGGPTYIELVENRNREERGSVLSFLEGLPVSLDIEVNDRKFHLVHGYPGETLEDQLWERPEAKMLLRPMRGKTVIVGHTPVQLLLGREDEVPLIWHGPGILDIDCGCGHMFPKRKFACLRLNDMKEFYV